ncbi:MAG: histidine phosphatase family protein [Saprospiraceae bacterium]|nr:histidine phosphatase family protein [Saprospiraceae bacterium]
MEKKLYILRHGETNENKAGIVQGQGIDSSLNELGLWQSLQFYNQYKSITFDKIITSGLRRSYQTLQHFETTENEIQRDTRINEISWGEHEGKAGEP